MFCYSFIESPEPHIDVATFLNQIITLKVMQGGMGSMAGTVPGMLSGNFDEAKSHYFTPSLGKNPNTFPILTP